MPLIINYSARTTAQQTQNNIMAKMDRRRKGVYGPPVGKKAIVFVDDLSMPQKEVYGAQPPIELLRTWLDHDFFYDLKEMSKFHLQDVQLLTAMGPPGGGGNTISPRMARHMPVITIHDFSESTMTHIFSTIANIHFKRGAYDGSMMRLGKVRYIFIEYKTFIFFVENLTKNEKNLIYQNIYFCVFGPIFKNLKSKKKVKF